MRLGLTASKRALGHAEFGSTPVFHFDRDLVCQGRLRSWQLARERARDRRKGDVSVRSLRLSAKVA